MSYLPCSVFSFENNSLVGWRVWCHRGALWECERGQQVYCTTKMHLNFFIYTYHISLVSVLCEEFYCIGRVVYLIVWEIPTENGNDHEDWMFCIRWIHYILMKTCAVVCVIFFCFEKIVSERVQTPRGDSFVNTTKKNHMGEARWYILNIHRDKGCYLFLHKFSNQKMIVNSYRF